MGRDRPEKSRRRGRPARSGIWLGAWRAARRLSTENADARPRYPGSSAQRKGRATHRRRLDRYHQPPLAIRGAVSEREMAARLHRPTNDTRTAAHTGSSGTIPLTARYNRNAQLNALSRGELYSACRGLYDAHGRSGAVIRDASDHRQIRSDGVAHLRPDQRRTPSPGAPAARLQSAAGSDGKNPGREHGALPDNGARAA